MSKSSLLNDVKECALARSGTDTGDVLVSMIDAVTGYSGNDPAGVTSQQLFENKAAVADYNVDNVSQSGDAADITGATALLDAVTKNTDTASENALELFVSANHTTLADALVLEEKTMIFFLFTSPPILKLVQMVTQLRKKIVIAHPNSYAECL